MLVLTRRPTQSFMIGNNITITVLEIKGSRVRIGIEAPRDVAIHREEILIKRKIPNGSSRIRLPMGPAEEGT